MFDSDRHLISYLAARPSDEPALVSMDAPPARGLDTLLDLTIEPSQ